MLGDFNLKHSLEDRSDADFDLHDAHLFNGAVDTMALNFPQQTADSPGPTTERIQLWSGLIAFSSTRIGTYYFPTP